ncbi:MAG: hypothetical protein V2A76_11590 [Planctomycetota bacterium]
MKITQAGASMISNAQQRLDRAAEKLVRNPTDPRELLELRSSEDEAKVAVKLIQAGENMTDTLLDVLA